MKNSLGMTDIDYKKLRFRRQYLLSSISIETPFNHNSVSLPNSYRLDYHTDLVFTEVKNNETQLVLLGDVYDSGEPKKSNQDILTECIDHSLPDLLYEFARMAGRFVAIFCRSDSIWIFNDVTAYRKIYYTNRDGKLICSSNQHLLAQLFDIKTTEDPSALKYYDSMRSNNYLNKDIGNHTCYDEIKQVLPNHFLEIQTGKVERFWPQSIPLKTSDEIAAESAMMIKGFMHAAANRYPLMIPITAGIDSRVLLAASREIRDKVFFYLNDSDGLKESADYLVPSKMLPRLGLKLNLLKINVTTDDIFRKIYFENNPVANTDYLDIIYNYLIHYPEKVNVPGNTIPVVKASMYFLEKKIDPHSLAGIYCNSENEFALEFYKDWLRELDGVCEKTNFNVHDLIFLEDYECNWAAKVQQDKDIGQEEFVVFNSAYLISLMLSYEKKKRQEPYHKLQKDIIDLLWPELLDFPINPSFKESIKKILERLYLYVPALRLKRFLFGK